MPAPLRRTFTILDAMVLLGAAAVGLLVAKQCEHFYGVSIVTVAQTDPKSKVALSGPLGLQAPLGPWGAKVVHWGVWSALVLSACSPALLVLRLLPPRPRGRRLFRQPGAVACAAATAALVAVSVSRAFFVPNMPSYPGLVLFRWGWVASYSAGIAVGAAWMTLALGGRWRPDPSWIDRCGRALGAGWVAVAACILLAGL
jgi:hypothetical protein